MVPFVSPYTTSQYYIEDYRKQLKPPPLSTLIDLMKLNNTETSNESSKAFDEQERAYLTPPNTSHHMSFWH